MFTLKVCALSLINSNPFYSDILIDNDNINNDLLCLSDVDAMFNLTIVENEDLEVEDPFDNECVHSDEMCAIPNIYDNNSNILEMAPGENRRLCLFSMMIFVRSKLFLICFQMVNLGIR